MNMAMMSRLMRFAFPIGLLVMAGSWSISAQATTNCSGGTCVFGDSGNNALNNEKARQNKEQWNDSRMLRKQENQRAEKDFTKYDNAVDLRDKCNASQNINAYWEPNTERCLDRRSGRSMLP